MIMYYGHVTETLDKSAKRGNIDLDLVLNYLKLVLSVMYVRTILSPLVGFSTYYALTFNNKKTVCVSSMTM